MNKAESFSMQYGYYDKEKKRACCVGYNAGYKQAEKDLALTWEDIQTIDNIVVDMARNTDWPLRGQEVFYTEVLRRFHESKEVK